MALGLLASTLDLKSVLGPHEEFSCCITSRELLILGTTFGFVHVATIDGIFITSTKVHKHAIEHVSVGSFDFVVAADIRGAIGVWEWTAGSSPDCSWGGDKPLCSILPSSSFKASSGQLILSFYDGHVVSRSRGTYFGFNDALLHTGGPDRSASDLSYFKGHLFFAVNDTVFAFSYAANRIVARLRPSAASDARAVLHICGGLLLAAWGSLICLCDLQDFDSSPFGAVRLVRVGAPVLSLGVVAHVVLVTCAPNGAGGTCNTLFLGLQSLKPLENTHLPIDQPLVAAGPSAAPSPTHCILWSQTALVCVRVPRVSEQVISLVQRNQFSSAMHIATRHPGAERMTIEVADMHGCHLWALGRPAAAMAVWGESVLPWAPAAYWERFIARLAAVGEIDLIVKWLPFNERGKVASSVYERLLLEPLKMSVQLTGQNGRLSRLLSRVAKWPVLYNTDTVRQAVCTALLAQGAIVLCRPGPAPTTPPESRDWPLLLATLCKLYEFGNRRLEAAQTMLLFKCLMRRSDCADATDLENSSIDLDEIDDEAHQHAMTAALATLQSVDVFCYFDTHGLWELIWPDPPTVPGHAVSLAESAPSALQRLSSSHDERPASSLPGANFSNSLSAAPTAQLSGENGASPHRPSARAKTQSSLLSPIPRRRQINLDDSDWSVATPQPSRARAHSRDVSPAPSSAESESPCNGAAEDTTNTTGTDSPTAIDPMSLKDAPVTCACSAAVGSCVHDVLLALPLTALRNCPNRRAAIVALLQACDAERLGAEATRRPGLAAQMPEHNTHTIRQE